MKGPWLSVLVLALSCAPAPASPRALATPPGSIDSTVRGLTPDAPFRAAPPPPEPRHAWAVPRLYLTTLTNGMHVLVAERRQPRLVAARLVVRGGAGTSDQAGLVLGLATTIAPHGSATREEHDVFEAMNTLFADVDAVATDDTVVLRLRSTSASFDAGLVLLRDIATEPAFAPKVVDRVRQQWLALLPTDADNPTRVALRLLFAAAYGPGHPYARARLWEGDALARATRDDLVHAWKRAVDPADATLVVAGDVDPAALAVRAESLFGSWKHDPAHPAPVDPPSPSPVAARLVVVDRPGAQQATIAYGMTTGRVASPGHLADLVANEMLGGMSSSTLTQTLRDRLRATALGQGSLEWRRGPGLSYWEGSVDGDRIADVLRTLDARVGELHLHGPASGELDEAKERVAQSLPDSFETVGGMVECIAQIPAFGLPVDEFDTLEARARAVTASDVRAAMPAPEATRAVVVGDLPSLRAQLVSLGWGDIEERDANGSLVRTFDR